MIRTYKIRLIPTEEQEAKMWQHVGASRYIWNYMLTEQKRRYDAGEKHLSAFGMNYLITEIKKLPEHEWMAEISTDMLYRSCADLDKAYKAFFSKQHGFPKYKSRKRDKPSFPLRDSAGSVWFSENSVTIPRIGKVAYKTNYQLPLGNKQKFSNPRIQYTANGKWLLTLGVECENQAPTTTDIPMGIDLGIKETAVVALGDEKMVFHNINKCRKVRQAERRLKHLQRSVSRKYRTNGSYEKTKNILKAEKMVKLAQYRLANIRQNYTHQMTHALVKLRPCRVVMEDLNVSGMMKNRHLSRAIAQQCFAEFIRQMKYKCEWNGIEFVQVGRFYPSSKTCSRCGEVKHGLHLGDRTYTCEHCGFRIDRDHNAAINLMRYVA